MSNLFRTFIALKICPENILQNLYEELQTALSGEAIKWVAPANLHLTMKFLGDTTMEQVEEVKGVLNKIGQHFYPFPFQLKGLGYFKNGGQPKVLFSKILGLEPIQQLFYELDRSLAEVGFEIENREFKPHLTLARIKFLKNKKLFYSLVDKFDETEIQKVKVSEIIYFQSILKPAGPVYIPLQKVFLKD